MLLTDIWVDGVFLTDLRREDPRVRMIEQQPLAVSLANYIGNGSAANPFGAVLDAAVVLTAPMVILFVVFQRYFVVSDLGSGVKG